MLEWNTFYLGIVASSLTKEERQGKYTETELT